AAAVDVGAALDADLIEGRTVQADALLAAAVALEHLGPEASRRPPARRALQTLRPLVGPRPLRTSVAAAAGVVAVSAAILVAAVLVFAIVAHLFVTSRKGSRALPPPEEGRSRKGSA